MPLHRGVGIGGATGARALPSLQHKGQGPPSLQRTVVNKLLSLTTSLLVESDNIQLLHTLLEHELTSGVRYLDNFNISLVVN